MLVLSPSWHPLTSNQQMLAESVGDAVPTLAAITNGGDQPAAIVGPLMPGRSRTLMSVQVEADGDDLNNNFASLPQMLDAKSGASRKRSAGDQYAMFAVAAKRRAHNMPVDMHMKIEPMEEMDEEVYSKYHTRTALVNHTNKDLNVADNAYNM